LAARRKTYGVLQDPQEGSQAGAEKEAVIPVAFQPFLIGCGSAQAEAAAIPCLAFPR